MNLLLSNCIFSQSQWEVFLAIHLLCFIISFGLFIFKLRSNQKWITISNFHNNKSANTAETTQIINIKKGSIFWNNKRFINKIIIGVNHQVIKTPATTTKKRTTKSNIFINIKLKPKKNLYIIIWEKTNPVKYSRQKICKIIKFK